MLGTLHILYLVVGERLLWISALLYAVLDTWPHLSTIFPVMYHTSVHGALTVKKDCSILLSNIQVLIMGWAWASLFSLETQVHSILYIILHVPKGFMQLHIRYVSLLHSYTGEGQRSLLARLRDILGQVSCAHTAGIWTSLTWVLFSGLWESWFTSVSDKVRT